MEIAGPIIDNVRFQSKGSFLEEMYLNLLTKASIQDTIHLVHPSFAHKLNQLSHDECILLYFMKHDQQYTGTSRISTTYDGKVTGYLGSKFEIPEEQLKKLIYPQNIAIYLDNLSSLDLVDELQNQGETTSTIRTDIRIMTLSHTGKIFTDACIPNDLDLSKYLHITGLPA
ncbi:MAG: Abi-alpha family protein [Pseudomonadota bacterium]|mgnify:FL=1